MEVKAGLFSRSRTDSGLLALASSPFWQSDSKTEFESSVCVSCGSGSDLDSILSREMDIFQEM